MRKISLLLLVAFCMFSAVAIMTGCDGDNNNDDEPFGVQNSIAGLWLLSHNTGSISELSDDQWKAVADADLLRLTTRPAYAHVQTNAIPDYGIFIQESIVSLDSVDPIYTGSTKKEDEPDFSQYYDFVFDLTADTCDVKYNVYFNGIMAYQISVLYDIALGGD